jgi:probable rRNA maturation factor
MTLIVNNEYEDKPEFDYEELIARVVKGCLAFEGFPYKAEISVLLTGDEEIRKLNSQFRQIDTPTDVLSFPTVEYSRPGDFTCFEDASADCLNPETGEMVLGDIVISVERAKHQAEEYGHSLKRELAFLTAHSMFHLMGYDHIAEEDRLLMEEKQKSLLNKLKILN